MLYCFKIISVHNFGYMWIVEEYILVIEVRISFDKVNNQELFFETLYF